MGYFSENYRQFFKNLAENNSKEWMDEHRKVYEKEVRDPFKEFVRDMILRIRQHDEEVTIDPKDAIFRINNDIRFNPEKPLYKIHMAAVVSRYGRKNMNYPGFYFQLGPGMVAVAGGNYMIDKKHLARVRHAIANDPDTFYEVTNNSSFTARYDEVRGEENKRLPPDLSDAAEKHPVIFKKQFYYWAEEEPSLIEKENLPEVLMEYYLAGKPFSDWLAAHYPEK